jgi:GntR family transcriptional regulator
MLASDGLIEQRRGAGTFVLQGSPKLPQSLSSLVSFTETIKELRRTSHSAVLSSGLFGPNAR